MFRKLFLKLKEKSSSFVFKTKHRSWFGIFLFLVILGIILPLQSAQALAWLAPLIAGAIILAVLQLLVALSIVIFEFAEGLLLFVIGPNYINIPYTTNEFVTLGWTLTRDFANMFFIIILVIIGLATALRLGEYQWQKTLPLLIGVALLINFTPIILGLIIDASNIIMNFFVSGIAEESFFVSRFQTYGASIFKGIKDANWTDPGTYLGFILIPLVYIIFNLIAAVVYLIFAALFMMRYVALWMLVILSPIAFLCYILPRTRGVFSTWWNQFIQWCFIGAVCAFFLYLGNQLLFLIPTLVPEGNQEGWGLVNSLVPYWSVMIFLIIGLFASLSTSAMGASAVIAVAQKGVKATGKWAGKTGVKTGVDVARGVPAVSRAEERIRRKLETVPVVGRAVGGVGAYEKERAKRMEESGKSFEKLPPPEIRRAFHQPLTTYGDRLKQARLYEILAEKGELGTGTPEETQREMAYLPTAQRYGINPNKILERLPHWAPRPEATPAQAREDIRRAVERMEPETFRKIQTEAFQTPVPPGAPPDTLPTYTDENLEVFYAMDLRKVTDLGLRGKRNKKEALLNLIAARADDIDTHIADLRTAGGPENVREANKREANKIEDMWITIANHPNYGQ